MGNQIDRMALETLLQRIADSHCGEADRINFMMTGDAQIELALAGKFARDRSTISDNDAFGVAEAKMVVEIASLVAGSVKAFLEIRKLRNELKPDESQAISLVWRQRLIEEGVSADKAQAIVSEFENEMKTVVK